MEGDRSEADKTAGIRLGIGRFLQELTLRLDQATYAHALGHYPEHLQDPDIQKHVTELRQQHYFPASTAAPVYGLDEQHVPKLCLYAAHDSSLIPLLRALGLHSDGTALSNFPCV